MGPAAAGASEAAAQQAVAHDFPLHPDRVVQLALGALASALVWRALAVWAAPAFAQWRFKRDIDVAAQQESVRLHFRARAVSDLHAALSCLLAVGSFAYGWSVPPDPNDEPFSSFSHYFEWGGAEPSYCSNASHWGRVKTWSAAGELFLIISSGYMVADLVDVIWNWKGLGADYGSIGHHVTAIVAICVSFLWQTAMFWSAGFFVTEVSTPLINRRWYMATIPGGRESAAYVRNGFAMLGVWFVVRVALIPMWARCLMVDLPAMYNNDAPFLLPFVTGFTFVALSTLNVLWFAKLVRGAVKALRGDRAKSAQKKKE